MGGRRGRLGDEPRRPLRRDASVALRQRVRNARRRPVDRHRLRDRRRGAPFRSTGVPALDRPDRRYRGALRALARDPRSRRADVRRLDRDRLRARACGSERPLDADRARPPDRRPDPRLAPAALRRADALRPQPRQDLPLRPQRTQLRCPGALVHRRRWPRPRRRLLPPAAERRPEAAAGDLSVSAARSGHAGADERQLRA